MFNGNFPTKAWVSLGYSDGLLRNVEWAFVAVAVSIGQTDPPNFSASVVKSVMEWTGTCICHIVHDGAMFYLGLLQFPAQKFLSGVHDSTRMFSQSLVTTCIPNRFVKELGERVSDHTTGYQHILIFAYAFRTCVPYPVKYLWSLSHSAMRSCKHLARHLGIVQAQLGLTIGSAISQLTARRVVCPCGLPKAAKCIRVVHTAIDLTPEAPDAGHQNEMPDVSQHAQLLTKTRAKGC